MHLIESSPNTADGYVPNNSNLFGTWIDSPTTQVEIVLSRFKVKKFILKIAIFFVNLIRSIRRHLLFVLIIVHH